MASDTSDSENDPGLLPATIIDDNRTTSEALEDFVAIFQDHQFEIIPTSGIDGQCALGATVESMQALSDTYSDTFIPVPTL